MNLLTLTIEEQKSHLQELIQKFITIKQNRKKATYILNKLIKEDKENKTLYNYQKKLIQYAETFNNINVENYIKNIIISNQDLEKDYNNLNRTLGQDIGKENKELVDNWELVINKDFDSFNDQLKTNILENINSNLPKSSYYKTITFEKPIKKAVKSDVDLLDMIVKTKIEDPKEKRIYKELTSLNKKDRSNKALNIFIFDEKIRLGKLYNFNIEILISENI